MYFFVSPIFAEHDLNLKRVNEKVTKTVLDSFVKMRAVFIGAM